MEQQDIRIRREATWLDLVCSAGDDRRTVALHPIAGEQGMCLALSVTSRLLRSTDGRITLFENLAAASRFLALAGVRHWAFGDGLRSIDLLLQGAEVLRLRSGRLRA